MTKKKTSNSPISSDENANTRSTASSKTRQRASSTAKAPKDNKGKTQDKDVFNEPISVSAAEDLDNDWPNESEQYTDNLEDDGELMTTHKAVENFARHIIERFIDEQLPLIPTRNLVMFPHMATGVSLSSPSALEALGYASRFETPVILVAQKKPEVREPKKRDLYSIGTLCLVQSVRQKENLEYEVVLQGIARVRLRKVASDASFLKAHIDCLQDIRGPLHREETARSLIVSLLPQFAGLNSVLANVIPNVPEHPDDFLDFADALAFYIRMSLESKQKILECRRTAKRLELIAKELIHELDMIKLQKKFRDQAEEVMEKEKRDYFLHQQIELMRRELGEGFDENEEIDKLLQRIDDAHMPPEAEEHAKRELRKMGHMPLASPDRSIIETYLDWMLRYPWSQESEDQLDIATAQQMLDEDHYGLKDVKERILEFLSVRQMKKDHHGPIICLVGPPGVGKTSIGRSIARTLGRKFNRTSLGGIHDEAEIRGHRRTYVGALPGRIIQAMCNVGSNNPVIMLDEIDKVGKDYRGDPAAALLEALDPEQNCEYRDHYMAIPTDLSKVMFIMTANITDTIPPALLDRMEVIRIPGYTIEEKVEIAAKYLVPKQLEHHGLSEQQFSIDKDLIATLIKEYTREAGVRNLDRCLAKLCRKRVRHIMENKCPEKIWDALNSEEMHEMLGVPTHSDNKEEKERVVGMVHGLSWTQVGGSILNIEANLTPGKGRLMLTGNLGNVMKESAKTAITWVRSFLHAKSIPFDYYKNDIHIHVPEGSIPKDGPSAGVTLASAFLSAVTKHIVSPELAMTGEITLTGRIMPVGGIKEKMLAAYNNDILTVYLPDENEKNLEDIPEDIRAKMHFIFVKHVDELFSHIFPKL